MWKIQKYRINSGYSQERLAEAVDLSTSYISEIENGKKRPSMKTLEKIAAVLGVPLVALMDDGPDAEQKKDRPRRAAGRADGRRAGRGAEEGRFRAVSFHRVHGFARGAC